MQHLRTSQRPILALAALLILSSCATSENEGFDGEGTPAILVDPEVGDEYELDPNRRTPSEFHEIEDGIGKSVSAAIEEFTDWSGDVTMQIVSCASSAPRQHQSVACSVDSGFVVVGGGALVDYGGGPGALLTESRPFDSDLRQWVASSKDHRAANFHNLVVYAVGMKLAGVSRATLASHSQLRQSTSGLTNYPAAQVSTSEGFVAVGGGARVNWTGVGNLLHASLPVDTARTWFASSKDQGAASPATITTFVIGLRASFLEQRNLEMETRQASVATFAKQVGSAAVSTRQGWVLTCPGAHADYNHAGRLLYGIIPRISGATARDKDHGGDGDSGLLTAYVRAIRKRP